jgi:cell division protein ZapE|tara:strand:+ start:407 stop:1444 length:1038 start_codon:yes stop_codon:yes gene_type:complete
MIQNITDELKNQGIELDLVQLELLNYLNDSFKKESNFLANFTKKKNINKSFYIWGDVGRGKTLITNEFIKNISLDKGVFHYIDFMHDIHESLSKLYGNKNPIDKIAKSLNKKYRIIFIDEFQVEDVADAMIIGNLLNQLIQFGVLIFLTSNAHPDNLYKNGLQRQKFMDSMTTIKNSLNIYELKGEKDYRTRNIYKVNNDAAKSFTYNDILDLIKNNFQISFPFTTTLKVNSREFQCKLCSKDVLWISFNNFFRQPTGSKDFKEICKYIDWIFVDDFKKCSENQEDIIRRFISFIDICYRENIKVKFFINNLDLDKIYSGTNLQILWNRCLSRLHEMQTIEYLER